MRQLARGGPVRHWHAGASCRLRAPAGALRRCAALRAAGDKSTQETIDVLDSILGTASTEGGRTEIFGATRWHAGMLPHHTPHLTHPPSSSFHPAVANGSRSPPCASR
jgi:hypothetical protein